MKKHLAIASVVVLLSLALIGTALAGPYHASRGVVGPKPKGDSNVLVMYRVDLPSVPTHLFVITEKTQVFGADGKPIPFAKLQEGDYIKEECMRRPDGKAEARKITVLNAETPFDR